MTQLGLFYAIRLKTVLNIEAKRFLMANEMLKSIGNAAVDDNTESSLWLFSIAYNNPFVISEQIRLIPKYIYDRVNYFVIDNSSDVAASSEIKKHCKENAVTYIKLPENPFNQVDPSRSNGLAMDWVYCNIIRKENIKYFGFIDHDIFPVAHHSIIDFLKKQGLYGLPKYSRVGTYLWAGFCFFDRDYVQNRIVGFMPVNGSDTGGCNIDTLYNKVDFSTLDLPVCTDTLYGENELNKDYAYESIGSWIHFMNASGWNHKLSKTVINKKAKEILSSF